MATGWVWHERFMWHDTGSGAGARSAGGYIEPGQHIENPTAKRRLRNLVEVSGLLDHLTPLHPKNASRDVLAAVHDPEYLGRLQRMSCARGGDAGENAPFGVDSYDTARLSAGGAIAAATAVLHGQVDNAYALVRPPGHHAERNRGRGFCLLNNVSIAAESVIRERLTDRVAVVDWDVHHGNGTEQIFYDCADVLTISIHQDRLYPPDTGDQEDRGTGTGWGYNINLPLPPAAASRHTSAR